MSVVNCANDKCENREAYFRQLQIRSADEPMTTFYKVRTYRDPAVISPQELLLTVNVVHEMLDRVARELNRDTYGRYYGQYMSSRA